MDRISPPPFKKSLEFNLPPAENVFSDDENEIWYIPSSVGETVKIEFVFKAGRYFERSLGEAQATLHLLDKGVRNKSAADIANELDYYGSSLDLKVGYDFATVALYALRKNIDTLLTLLSEILQKPKFPEKELLLLKKIFVENLRVNLGKNEFVASNLIRKSIYRSHPYGKNLQIEDIEGVTLDNVRSYFRDRFVPFKIFIVGRVNPETIQSIIKSFNLNGTPATYDSPTISEVAPEKNFIDGPNNKQASIRLGHKTISKTHPDWAGLQLVNYILGGYFGSRLMKNIREEKGLTYGIHSSIQSMQHSSLLSISAEVNSSSVELALKEINNELRDLVNIKDAELEMAKNHFIGSLQNDVATIFSACERIKSLMLNNLPPDFYKKLIEEVNNLSRVEIERICNSHFLMNNFSTVIVK